MLLNLFSQVAETSVSLRTKLAFEIKLELSAFNRHSSCRNPELEELDPRHQKTCEARKFRANKMLFPSSLSKMHAGAIGPISAGDKPSSSRERSRWAS